MSEDNKVTTGLDAIDRVLSSGIDKEAVEELEKTITSSQAQKIKVHLGNIYVRVDALIGPISLPYSDSLAKVLELVKDVSEEIFGDDYFSS